MARKLIDIKNQITTAFIGNVFISNYYGLELGKTFEQQFSAVSLESILFDVFSFAVWTLETLFDLHKNETNSLIAELKPHSSTWYRNAAKNFQYGYSLITDSDKYDNTGLTDEAIAVSKIIKYAAVTESVTESRLILKVATEIGNKLQPITLSQRNSFSAYMQEIKDAGVRLSIINYLPDRLYLFLVIYFDPLVLDERGNSIVEGGRPVEEALEGFMKDLPFNGEMVLAHLVDKLQTVHGVSIPDLVNAQTSWIDGSTNNYGAIQTINVKKIPESGYFEIVNYNNITYKPNV